MWCHHQTEIWICPLKTQDRPIIYKQLSLPGEREEELLELYTDDAVGYKFTVVHYQYSSG